MTISGRKPSDGVFATTIDLILYEGTWNPGQTIETAGYSAAGGKGVALWILTGNTLAAVSQPPSLTTNGTLSDGNGNEFSLVHNGNIHASQLGVIGDGVSDDTLAMQAALNVTPDFDGLKVSILGLRVRTGNIIVPPGVSLIAGESYITKDTYESSYFTSVTGTILLDALATIKMQNSALLKGLQVFPFGMAFPQPTSVSYTGTAVTVDAVGVGINTIDVVVDNCLIVGFDRAVDAFDSPRLILRNLNFDCQNGVRVDTAGDPIKFTDCHGWPFGTIAHPVGGGGEPADPGVRDRRTGVAYEFINNADAGKVYGCFAFAYNIGHRINNVNGLTFVNSGADNYNLFPTITSTGFDITGNCGFTSLIGCQAVAHVNGINMNANNTDILQIQGGLYSVNTTNVVVAKGNVTCSGTAMGSAVRAFIVGDVGARLAFDQVTFQGITGEVIANNGGSPLIYIDSNNITDDINVPMYAGAVVEKSVASTASVNLPLSGESVLVTGTTNIFGFIGGWPGRIITLRFDGALTLSDAAGMNLAGNFVTSANDTLTIQFTSAVQSYEVSRSVN